MKAIRYLPAPPAARAPAETDLFDWGLMGDRLRFALRAPRRHPLVAGGALAGCLGLVLLSLLLLPWTYRAEVKLLADRNLVMAALGNPGRAVPRDADMPTRGAADEILRHDQLVALIDRADLVAEWKRSRAPLSRAKGWLFGLIRSAPTAEEEVEALVAILEKRLRVDPGDGALTISVEWPEPVVAARIVDNARQLFVEGRQARELANITDVVEILEKHAARARTEMDEALKQVAQVSRHGRGRAVRIPLPSASPPPVELETERLRAELAATRRAIEEVESARRRRRLDLEAELARLLSIYSPAHPSVAAAEQGILSVAGDSAQEKGLRERGRALAAELERRVGRGTEGPAWTWVDDGSTSGEGELLEHSRTRLRTRAQKHEELLARLGAARIELDTTRAAFKYRYDVLRPAQVPRGAESPSVPLALMGGLLVGTVLGVLLAAAVDLARGTAVEAWQLQRALGLPVLALMRAEE